MSVIEPVSSSCLQGVHMINGFVNKNKNYFEQFCKVHVVSFKTSVTYVYNKKYLIKTNGKPLILIKKTKADTLIPFTLTRPLLASSNSREVT